MGWYGAAGRPVLEPDALADAVHPDIHRFLRLGLYQHHPLQGAALAQALGPRRTSQS
jgi:hypothetical protein